MKFKLTAKKLWLIFLCVTTLAIWDVHDTQGTETAIYLLLLLIWTNTCVLIIYLEDVLQKLEQTTKS